MDDYIRREAAIEAAKHAWAKGLEPTQYIEIIPHDNVREDVKAKWAHLGGDEWCCTACGNVIFTEGSWEKPTKKFCDECGADMRGDIDETDSF